MKTLDESIAMSMDCQTIELIPFLPYILQDFHEIGSHAESINNIIKDQKRHDKIDILDLGCGKGAILNFLAQQHNSNCLGIDAMASFIDYANDYKTRNRITNSSFIVGDARNTEIIPGLYDFIIMGSIGPIFENYTIAFQKLRKLLKDDGIVILDEGYMEDGKNHDVTLNKKELYSQIEKAGMLILKEYTGAEVCIQDEFDGQLENIKKRCKELIEKYPDKESIFIEYIHEQEREYSNLESDITCSTMIIKKMA